MKKKKNRKEHEQHVQSVVFLATAIHDDMESAIREVIALDPSISWSMVLELLRDFTLDTILLSRHSSPQVVLDIFLPTLQLMENTYQPAQVDFAEKGRQALYSIKALLFGALGELERRRPQFTRSVTLMQDPFAYDFDNPFQYELLEGVDVSLDDLIIHHHEQAMSRLQARRESASIDAAKGSAEGE